MSQISDSHSSYYLLGCSAVVAVAIAVFVVAVVAVVAQLLLPCAVFVSDL